MIWQCVSEKPTEDPTEPVCFWRDKTWVRGETIDVNADWKWQYSGGWWHPEAIDVVDPALNLLIPRHFEPLDFSILVDPKDVYRARRNLPVERSWKFKAEIERSEEDLDALPDPTPIHFQASPKPEPEVMTPMKAQRTYKRRGPKPAGLE